MTPPPPPEAGGGVVQSAALRRLRHPQEESPLWGLACGAVGGAFALALSLPLLAAFLALLPLSLLLRALVLRCCRPRPPSAASNADDEEAAKTAAAGENQFSLLIVKRIWSLFFF